MFVRLVCWFALFVWFVFGLVVLFACLFVGLVGLFGLFGLFDLFGCRQGCRQASMLDKQPTKQGFFACVCAFHFYFDCILCAHLSWRVHICLLGL